jgi:hypothetical protein
MKLKLLSAAAFSLALMGGVAFAQDTTSSTATSDNPNQNTESDAVFLGNAEKMTGFYTDNTMGALKTDEELRTAWTAMSAEDQAAMRGECETLSKGGGGEPSTADAGSPSTAQLCGKISAF